MAHALNGTHSSRISPTTQRAIIEAARQLQYQPGNLTTHTIGYVLPVDTLVLETEAAFLVFVERALREHGYRLTLTEVETAGKRPLQEVLNPKTVDGVIFMRWHQGVIQSLLSPDVPWVLASDEENIPGDVDLLTVDTAQTFANATKYLLRLGHKHIGLLLQQHDTPWHRRMKGGIQRALRGAGLSPSHLRLIEEGDASLLDALRQLDAPTAIIIAKPSAATAALYTLSRAGIETPRDVSLLSVYDSVHFERFNPHLTATTVFNEALAQRIVQRLLQRIRQPETPLQQVRIAGEVIERLSTAAPREGS